MKNARLKTLYFVMSAAFAVASVFVIANLPVHDTPAPHSFAASALVPSESVAINPAEEMFIRPVTRITGS